MEAHGSIHSLAHSERAVLLRHTGTVLGSWCALRGHLVDEGLDSGHEVSLGLATLQPACQVVPQQNRY